MDVSGFRATKTIESPFQSDANVAELQIALWFDSWKVDGPNLPN